MIIMTWWWHDLTKHHNGFCLSHVQQLQASEPPALRPPTHTPARAWQKSTTGIRICTTQLYYCTYSISNLVEHIAEFGCVVPPQLQCAARSHEEALRSAFGKLPSVLNVNVNIVIVRFALAPKESKLKTEHLTKWLQYSGKPNSWPIHVLPRELLTTSLATPIHTYDPSYGLYFPQGVCASLLACHRKTSSYVHVSGPTYARNTPQCH